jgi:hypothetical protein
MCFGLALLCCAHLNRKVARVVLLVGKFWHQTLPSKSGILWICDAFKTTWNSEGSSGQSSRKRPEFPTWNSELDDCSKRIFPVGTHFFPEFPIVLILLKRVISPFRVCSCFERAHTSCWIDCMANV